MGGDGGCIPRRADMVQTKGYDFVRGSAAGGMGYNANYIGRKGEDKITPKERRRLRMRHCAISQDKLRTPVSACRMGNLFNKDAIIGAILSKISTPLPKELDHIKGLKDLKDAKLCCSSEGAPFCPVTQKELDDGITRSILLWSCGCVLAKQAFQLRSSECPSCSQEFSKEDQILLMPDPHGEELKEAKEKLTAWKSRNSKKRKSEKEKEGCKGTEVEKRPRKNMASDAVSLRSCNLEDDGLIKKVRKKQIEEYRKNDAFNKIFIKDGEQDKARTDAFGWGFSSKGVGI